MASLQDALTTQNRLLELTGETYAPEAQPFDEQRAAKLEALQPGPSLKETLSAAAQLNFLEVSAYKYMRAESFAPDPEFFIGKLPEDKKAALFAGVDPQTAEDEFGQAVSYDHAMAIRDRILNAQELHKTLEDAGWTGTAANLGAALLDPITLVTGGPAMKAMQLWKAGRAAKVIAGSLMAGTAIASGTSMRNYGDPTITNTDIAVSFGIGALLGGVGGAVSGRVADASTKVIAAMDGGEPLRPWQHEANRLFGPHLEAEAESSLSTAATPKATEGVSAKAPEGSGPAAMGAAPASDPLTASVDEPLLDRILKEAPDPKMAKGDLGSMYGSLMKSGNEVAAWLVNKMVPNPVGKGFQPASAWDEALNVLQPENARYRKVYGSSYKEWAADQGLGFLKRHGWEAQDRFAEEVGIAVRTGEAAHPAVKQAADAIAETNKRVLSWAKEAGVEGFDNVEENANYLMRRWRLDRLNSAAEKLGKPGLSRFLGDALVKGTAKAGGKIDPDKAETIANAVLKTVVDGKFGIDQKVGGATTRKAVEYAKQLLKDKLGETFNADEDMIEEALTGLFRSGKADQSSRAKMRVRFDEGHSAPLFDNAGREVGRMRFADLIENNALLLQEDYLREMSGRIGLARMGLETEADWQKMIDTMRARASQLGGVDQAAMRGHEDTLNVLRNIIMGRPVRNTADFPTLRRVGRLMRNYNFARVMGSVGLAQIPEIGNVIGTAGLKAVLRNIPALGSIIKRAKNGELEESFQRELEDALGIGAEHFQHDTFGRFDEYGSKEAQGWNRVDRGMQAVNNYVADHSLLTPFTNLLEKMAVRSMTQHMADMAAGRIKGLSRERFAALGLDEASLDKVLQHLKPRAEGGKVDMVEGTVGGMKINKLNLAEWDATAAHDFRVALQRYARRAIQRNDPGDLLKFMTTDMGKTIFQFRSFTVSAYAKQLVHGLRHRDIHTAVSFAAATGLGALSYTAMVAAQGVARNDREEFFKERLSPGAIAAGAFARTGFSTLIPQLVDSGLYLGDFDPIFAHTRSTGLSTQMLWGNPTVDLMDTTMAVGRSVAQSFHDPSKGILTSEGARKASRLLPLQNAFGISQGLDLMTGALD